MCITLILSHVISTKEDNNPAVYSAVHDEFIQHNMALREVTD